MLGKYRKMHIPDDPLFYEKFYFTPGDLGYQVFDTASSKARRWRRHARLLGPVVPGGRAPDGDAGRRRALLPDGDRLASDEREGQYGAAQHDAWETIQRSHAIANGCYVVGVNRVGFETTPGAATADEAGPYVAGQVRSGIEFWGASFVAAPDGRVLARASHDAEEVLVVDLDLDRLDAHRTVWPFFRDRRVDSYGAIERRWID